MPKLRTLVVDDEPLAREGIAGYVADIPFLELVCESNNALNANEILQNRAVDLVFLDINMPRLSGVDFIKNLSDPPMVIFTTAYRKYAIEAYELDAIDYLVKPVSFDRFMKAASKARNQLELREKGRENSGEDVFFVKENSRYERIAFKNVDYIEGLKDYIQIYTGKKRHLVLISMKEAEERLPIDQFIRVHRSFIVNKEKVSSIEGNQLLIGEAKVPISRQLKVEVIQKMIGDQLWSKGS